MAGPGDVTGSGIGQVLEVQAKILGLQFREADILKLAKSIVDGAKKANLSFREFQVQQLARGDSSKQNLDRLRKSNLIIPDDALKRLELLRQQREARLQSKSERVPRANFELARQFQVGEAIRISKERQIATSNKQLKEEISRLNKQIPKIQQERILDEKVQDVFKTLDRIEEKRLKEEADERGRKFFDRMNRNTPSGLSTDRRTDTFFGMTRDEALEEARRNRPLPAGSPIPGSTMGGPGLLFQFAPTNTPIVPSIDDFINTVTPSPGIFESDGGGGGSQLGDLFDQFNFQGVELEKVFGDINVLGQEFETIFSSAFDRLIAGGMEFDDVLKQLAIDIGKLILKKALFGGEGGGDGIVGAAIGGILSGIGGAFGGPSGPTASQASFSAAFGTGFMAFAAGGPIRARQLALVGERGPELFVPGTSGSIIPNGRFGVSTGSSMIIENIDARGADAQAVARLESTLKDLDARVDRVDRSVEPRVAGFMADRFIRRGTAKRVLKR